MKQSFGTAEFKEDSFSQHQPVELSVLMGIPITHAVRHTRDSPRGPLEHLKCREGK